MENLKGRVEKGKIVGEAPPELLSGRPISRSEALRIAAQILERAGRERIEVAEWEAKRGIQWEVGE